MGWERKKHEHECRTPSSLPMFRRVRDGDEWVCRRCGTRWRLLLRHWPGYRYSMDWRRVA